MHPQIRTEIKALLIFFFQDYSILVSGDCGFGIQTSWVKAGSLLETCVIQSVIKYKSYLFPLDFQGSKQPSLPLKCG